MKKKLFVVALFVSFFGSGFEHTFLNTLFSVITYDLGGIEYFTWAAISFTLGNLIFLPLVGRLADRYNKMYLFLLGNTLMIIGAILCAFSQNMFQLILFRFIMGIGSGVITIMISMMVGIVFSVNERVKWNALLGVVYSISTFIGPIVAGFLVLNI